MYSVLDVYEQQTDESIRQQDMQPTTFAELGDALRHVSRLQRHYPGYPLYVEFRPVADERHEYEVWGDGSRRAYVPEHEGFPF